LHTEHVTGVHRDTHILTQDGWRALTATAPGTQLAHPTGLPSTLVEVTELSARVTSTITLADRTSIELDNVQKVAVLVGGRRRPALLNPCEILAGLRQGQRFVVPQHEPYAFGTPTDLPLDGYLLGALIGDAYLRPNGIQWCNQQVVMHELVSQALPAGSTLTPLKYGQAGTGSATIVGTARGNNPVLDALRSLGLIGCRAWEKHVPRVYRTAPLPHRAALFAGLMDTDGSIDQVGRMEFGTSSEQLGQDVLELIHSLGGRATLSRRDNVTFTSPRQATPKAGRPCFRLTNIRVPSSITPFRRPEHAARLRPTRTTRHWKIVDVAYAGIEPVLAVTVSAIDDLWIAQGAFSIVGNPAAAAQQAAS
jgi:hypothetical protein